MLRPILKAKPDVSQTMTVMQVAAALQLSRSKTYEIVRGNGFPKIRVGKRLLVPKVAFQEWLKRNTIMSYGDEV